MKLLEIFKGEKIQNRKIDISTYECNNTHVLVYGELKDSRLVPTYTVEGKPRDASMIHHMRICIKVALASLEIDEIEVELPVTPHDECAEMKESLDRIRGLSISPGFTSEVRRRVGGRKGCIHLTTLLLAMAPAVLQGYWVHMDRNPEQRELSGEHMEQFLVDSCYVWRREGALTEKIARAAGVTLDPKK